MAELVDPFDADVATPATVKNGYSGGLSDPFDLPADQPVTTESSLMISRDASEIPRFEGKALSPLEQGKVALGLFTTADPLRQAQIIKGVAPEASFRVTDTGKLLVKLGQEVGFVNKPGLDFRDVVDVANDVLKFYGPMKFAQFVRGAAGTTAALASAGASGGAVSIAEDLASQGLGASEGVDVGKAGITALTNVAGEAAAPVIGGAMKVAREIISKPNLVANGRLTAEGVAFVRKAGFNPRELQDIIGGLADLEANRAVRAIPGQSASNVEAIARDARAAEFGIELTEGQATKDLRQLSREDTLRNADVTSSAGDVMRQQESRQAQQISGASDRIQGGFSGGKQQVTRLDSAGEALSEGISLRHAAARREVDEAYAAARELNGSFSPDGIRDMIKSLRGITRGEILPRSLFPGTNEAIDQLAKLDSLIKNVKGIRPFTIRRIEKMRQQLTKLERAAQGNPEDARMLLKLRKGMDQWLDEAVDTALFSGDDAALAAMKEARASNTRLNRLFGRRNGYDPAAKIIETLSTGAVDGVGAINYIFGAGKIGGKQASVEAVKRLKSIFGADSESWNTLREAAWLRIMSRGMKGGGVSRQNIVSAIDDALDGSGASVMKELYSAKELMQIRRFRAAVADTIPDAKAGNPSRTSYKFAQMFQQASQALGFAVSSMSGNPLLALASFLPAANRRLDWARARKAVSGFSPPDRTAATAAGAAGVGAAARQQVDMSSADEGDLRP